MCFRPDGCGDNVAVVGIGQGDGGHEILETGDQGVAHMGVHEAARAFQPLRAQVRTAAEQRTDPLLVDRQRPLRPE